MAMLDGSGIDPYRMNPEVRPVAPKMIPGGAGGVRPPAVARPIPDQPKNPVSLVNPANQAFCHLGPRSADQPATSKLKDVPGAMVARVAMPPVKLPAAASLVPYTPEKVKLPGAPLSEVTKPK